jgi:hypothetical protein
MTKALRFAPYGHSLAAQECQFCANSGHAKAVVRLRTTSMIFMERPMDSHQRKRNAENDRYEDRRTLPGQQNGRTGPLADVSALAAKSFLVPDAVHRGFALGQNHLHSKQ